MPLEDPDVRELLSRLVQLDVDAVVVYDEVLPRLQSDERACRELASFKADHERHIERLFALIRRLGGEPPQRKPDVTGRIAEWSAALRSTLADDGAMRAIRAAEEYHVNRYGEAAGWDVAGDVREELGSFLEDEKRHLAFAEEQLAEAATSA